MRVLRDKSRPVKKEIKDIDETRAVKVASAKALRHEIKNLPAATEAKLDATWNSHQGGNEEIVIDTEIAVDAIVKATVIAYMSFVRGGSGAQILRDVQTVRQGPLLS